MAVLGISLLTERGQRLLRSQRLGLVTGIAVLAALLVSFASQYLVWTEFREPAPESESPPYVRAHPAILPNTGPPQTTSVKWNTGDREDGQVWVALNGVDHAVFAQGRRGTRDAPFIGSNSVVEFRLYEGTAHTTLLSTSWARQQNRGSTEAAWRGIVAVAVVLLGLGGVAAITQRMRSTGANESNCSAELLTRAARVTKIDALTSLRFPAAAIIVFLHFRDLPGFSPVWGWPFPYPIGVTFFFVLSGFILTYVYPSLTPSQIPRFWWARIARIWPAHVTALLFAVLMLPHDFVNPSGRVWPAVAHLLMLQAWIPNPNSYFAFNQPSWSISTELAFYLSFPLLLMLLARSRVRLVFASAALLGGMIVVCNWLFEGPDTLPSLLTPEYLIYQNPLSRQFEFILGMCACHVWRRVRTSALVTPGHCTIAELATLAASFGVAYGAGQVHLAIDAWLGDASSVWLMYSGVAIPFAALIGAVALNQGLLSRVLSVPPLVLLGEISYSVYLVHYTVARVLITSEWAHGDSPWLVYAGAWTATLILAYLVWPFVEMPARRYLVGLVSGSPSRRRRPATEVVGASV